MMGNKFKYGDLVVRASHPIPGMKIGDTGVVSWVGSEGEMHLDGRGVYTFLAKYFKPVATAALTEPQPFEVALADMRANPGNKWESFDDGSLLSIDERGGISCMVRCFDNDGKPGLENRHLVSISAIYLHRFIPVTPDPVDEQSDENPIPAELLASDEC